MSEPLIFDTSVWIDFFRNKSSPQSDLLTAYVENNDPVLLTPTILQEILQGIQNDNQYHQVKETLSYFSILQIAPVVASIGAAELYRSLRKKGLTIRKGNDCLIAFYEIECSTPLVHIDGDFDRTSEHTNLQTWPPKQ